MTIKRTHKWLKFECDDCDTSADFETDYIDFDTAWAQLKAEGWRAKKIGKDWVHGCPEHGRDL